MELPSDACYRALASRDARFDGRFFVGVRSTGVYCRPICPARTPLRRNVEFFPCAASAAEAGFRPCLRCRPEASPGTPAWLGTSTTVSRALRLIGEGALDAANVDVLAERVGVGSRHLRRLFDEHVGASPIAVAQTRRIHFAKRLLDETSLPMTRIADAAGFASVRRFNSAMKEAYGRAPRELRRERGVRESAGDSASLELRLAYRPPLDWSSLLAFLAARAIPGVEKVSDERYTRSIRVDGATGYFEVRHATRGHALLLTVPSALSRNLMAIAEGARRIFDLGADPIEISELLRRDPALRALLARHPGLRVPGAWDGFELAARVVLGQQVSVAGASALAGRLVERWGTPLERPCGSLTHVFPEPLALSRVDLGRIGLPRTRARALRRLAHEVATGALALDAHADSARTTRALQELPGIGPWTASVVAMRALREPDAFPAGDLGLRKALAGGSPPLSERAVLERAESWRPWRAYAAMALWRSLDA